MDRQQTTSQFKQLPDYQRRIGYRVVYARKCFGMSQQRLAVEAKMTLARLANVEAARVPLRAGAALRICSALDIHPGWLHLGRKERAFTIHDDVTRGWLSNVAYANEQMQFWEFWNKIGFLFLEDESTNVYLQKLAASGHIPNLAGSEEKSLLTETANYVKGWDVKKQWPVLKRKIQKATTIPGEKSKLANFLRVDLTQLSKWLTDAKSAREPGAEYALRMKYWAEHPECQQ